MAHIGKHAVVVGAGMGGLLAGSRLADHFDDVTILSDGQSADRHAMTNRRGQ
jgi:cation diffusion facilitator CzcD-associated flavoprotein CzcO